MHQVPDQWAFASTYERFMGRWSRRLAREFVTWLQIPKHVHWLEMGCGTGALTTAICDYASPATVVACDPARPFIEYARTKLHDDRVTFVVAGVDDFPARVGSYGSITSLLAFNFFPDHTGALQRMRAAAAPGSVISACVWDYAEGMQFLRYFWAAATEINAAAQQHDEAERFTICEPRKLSQLFRAVLVDVRCEPIEIATRFASFDDYWRPLLGGTGPAPSFVASLDEDERARLRDNLRRRLPAAADGAIGLTARAWAVSGVRP